MGNCLRAMVLIVGAMVAFTATAQTAAVLDPANALHTVAAGSTISERVNVQNPGQFPLELQIYLADWKHSQTGSFEFLDAGTLDSSLLDWISFPSEPLSIAANGHSTIDYTVTVPSDALPGTYWGVLFVESRPGDVPPGVAATTFSVRVGHIIYVNVPELTSSGAITGIFGESPQSEADPFRVIGLYSNSGNSMQIIQGALTVRDSNGSTVIEVEIPRRVVLPQSTRAIVVNLVGPLPAGNYTAVLVLDYGDESREVAGALDIQLSQPLAEPPANPDDDHDTESDQP